MIASTWLIELYSGGVVSHVMEHGGKYRGMDLPKCQSCQPWGVTDKAKLSEASSVTGHTKYSVVL